MTLHEKATLLAIQKGFDQVALVVEDLDKAVETYWSLLGIGPWAIYTYGRPLVKEMSYRGSPADFSFRVAFTKVGDVAVELIESLEGDTIYADFARERGYGVHHFGKFVEDMGPALEEARAAGFTVIQEGSGFGLDGSGHYAYLDTEATIGVTLEFIELPKERAAPERMYPPAV